MNIQRHQIDFEEAKTIFNDPFLLTFPDADHSEGEYRYLSIGQVSICTNIGRDSY
ncbi:MAG: BrnT family toxin [Sedimentisphaerales bacterium]|nr:BrnT family toxin [Sedimentisphaerales bacterium]